MKFLSIDTETTGLNPKSCQILSIAGVLEDTLKPEVPVEELPHFEFIFNHKLIKGEPYALNMNKNLIEIINEGNDKRLIDEGAFTIQFKMFLMDNDIDPASRLKVVGKNFSTFDKKFIEKTYFWETDGCRFHYRILDVGSLFVNFKEDEWVPDLNECMKRAGIKGSVQHTALEDARDVIRVLRTKY